MVFCLVAVLSFKGEDEGLGTAARGRAPVLLGLPDLSLPRWPFTSCEPHRPAVRACPDQRTPGEGEANASSLRPRWGGRRPQRSREKAGVWEEEMPCTDGPSRRRLPVPSLGGQPSAPSLLPGSASAQGERGVSQPRPSSARSGPSPAPGTGGHASPALADRKLPRQEPRQPQQPAPALSRFPREVPPRLRHQEHKQLLKRGRHFPVVAATRGLRFGR